MLSNEHPDMSGNPCDDPIVCDQCGKACNENELYGSDHDENKNFCRKQCVDDWEDGWESVPSEDDGLTRTEQKIRNLVAIRSYLRDRVDELVESRLLSQANAVAAEVSRLNLLIAEAEAAE